MQCWEYLTVYVQSRSWHDSLSRRGSFPENRQPAELLNELGEQGWELVGTSSGSDASVYRLFLKRSLP